MSLEEFPVRVRMPLRWGDMDAFGHANNTFYFVLFESARIAYFERMKVVPVTEASGVGAILASTACRFRAPLTYPDTVEVGARVPLLREDRFPMEYAVHSEALGRVVARGEGMVVAYDYDRRAKAELPASWRRAIAEIQGTALEPTAGTTEALVPDGRGFLAKEGPARRRGDEPCRKKLCFTSTRLEPLRLLLGRLSERQDCWYVKVDAEPGSHGMYRGRCFLTSPDAVGEAWRRHKVHDDYLCTVQDDDFTERYR